MPDLTQSVRAKAASGILEKSGLKGNWLDFEKDIYGYDGVLEEILGKRPEKDNEYYLFFAHQGSFPYLVLFNAKQLYDTLEYAGAGSIQTLIMLREYYPLSIGNKILKIEMSKEYSDEQTDGLGMWKSIVGHYKIDNEKYCDSDIEVRRIYIGDDCYTQKIEELFKGKEDDAKKLLLGLAKIKRKNSDLNDYEKELFESFYGKLLTLYNEVYTKIDKSLKKLYREVTETIEKQETEIRGQKDIIEELKLDIKERELYIIHQTRFIKKQESRIEELESQIEELESQIDQLDKINEQQRKELYKKEFKIFDLKEKKQKLKKQLEEAEKIIKDKQAEIETLTKEKEELKEQLKEAEKTIEEQKKIITQLETEIQAQKTRIAALEEAKKELEEKLKKANETIAKLTAKIENFKKKLKKAGKLVARQKKEIEKQYKLIQMLISASIDLRKEIERQSGQIAALQREKLVLGKELSAEKEESAKKDKIIAAQAARIEELEKQLAAEKGENKRLTMLMKQLEAKGVKQPEIMVGQIVDIMNNFFFGTLKKISAEEKAQAAQSRFEQINEKEVQAFSEQIYTITDRYISKNKNTRDQVIAVCCNEVTDNKGQYEAIPGNGCVVFKNLEDDKKNFVVMTGDFCAALAYANFYKYSPKEQQRLPWGNGLIVSVEEAEKRAKPIVGPKTRELGERRKTEATRELY